MPGNQHVVVLGGGASGTSAAYSLNQLGYRTTILDHQPLAAITVARTAGQIVVKHFANGQIGPQLLQHDDDSIKRTLLSASPLAAQATPPLTTVVQRWPTAVPSFSPQHLQNLAARHAQPQPGRLALAGDYLVAPCIEGAVRSGQAAAAAVHAALRHF
ncbi:MAG TPA: FAD-dependent oxidoreductase [Candidatus Saccharimonadia bacterium]